MKISVIEVTESFNVSNITVWNRSDQTISWHTADTENAPVSCAAVDILLSTDSGQSFTEVLASQTANDGTQAIKVPNLTTSTARVKIACSDNIFFAINNADFIINVNDATPTKPVFTGQVTIATNEDIEIAVNDSMLTFENNQAVDSLQILDGENYTFNNLTIMPNANFYGNILVSMTATADDLVSDIFQVTININAVNDQPVAVDDEATVAQDSSGNTIDVLTNDSDIEDQTITLISASSSGSGSVQIVDNKISYTPETGFSGTEVISYTIEDSEQASASGELSITVTTTPPPPIVTPDNSSSGGSIYYLLIVLVLTLGRKTIKGQANA